MRTSVTANVALRTARVPRARASAERASIPEGDPVVATLCTVPSAPTFHREADTKSRPAPVYFAICRVNCWGSPAVAVSTWIAEDSGSLMPRMVELRTAAA